MPILIDLGPEVEKRLNLLTLKIGRAKFDLLRELIERGLDDLEDFYLADAVMERIGSGSEKVLCANRARQELDLN